jgi:hypothetical protein
VRRLAAEGEIQGARRLGRTLVLDSEPVHPLAREPRRRRRPWSERVAWAALRLLSGGGAAWLSSAELSRLKRRLQKTTVDNLQYLAARRARVLVFRARSTVLPDLAAYLVPTRASALSATRLRVLGLTAGHRPNARAAGALRSRSRASCSTMRADGHRRGNAYWSPPLKPLGKRVAVR